MKTKDRRFVNFVWLVMVLTSVLLYGTAVLGAPQSFIPITIVAGAVTGFWMMVNRRAKTMNLCGQFIYAISPILGLALLFSPEVMVSTHASSQGIVAAWVNWLEDIRMPLDYPIPQSAMQLTFLRMALALPIYIPSLLLGMLVSPNTVGWIRAAWALNGQDYRAE